jgi:hypothetical protein
MDDVPIQYFQSVIAIELAVTGALLFQIRYFAPRRDQAEEDLPDPLLRLAVAVVLGATLSARWRRCSTVETRRRPPR